MMDWLIRNAYTLENSKAAAQELAALPIVSISLPTSLNSKTSVPCWYMELA